jgi:GNAT superfamily N-acetyltransferase
MTSPPIPAVPIVREAVAGDMTVLASLVSALGYPVASEVLSSRIQKMPSSHRTFVAELDGAVVGFIGCSPLDIYESDLPVCWIMALSVADRFRRRGVGRALLRQVEAWCAATGLSDLRVHSGEQRADAHALYEACGFEHTGRRFKKSLATSVS